MIRLTKQEVRLHLRSGEVLRFFAKSITVTRNTATNDLTGIEVDGVRGWPLYFRLDHVSAVTTHFVPLWRALA